MQQPETRTVTILDEEAGVRLDALLVRRFPDWSRAYFQGLIEQGNVLVEGASVKKRTKLLSGQQLTVTFTVPQSAALLPEEIPLELIFEDAHLVVVNKPAGMVVHPAPGHWDHTLVNALLAHCPQLAGGTERIRPGIVHRLDKETSGLIICAKTPAAHYRLGELFHDRQVVKSYLALCVGYPGSGEVQTRIGRHARCRTQMANLSDRGKEAVSRYRTLAQGKELSLVEIELKTGRTHQARLHMKHLGTPILGDPLYGSDFANRKYGVSRQLLHAARLSFVHPFTGALLNLSAPLPDDFKKQLEKSNIKVV